MGPETLVRRYEELRSYALGEVQGSVPRGLALFVRYGLPTWAEAWSSLTLAPAPRVLPRAGEGHPRPVSVQHELVMALVGMALSCRGR